MTALRWTASRLAATRAGRWAIDARCPDQIAVFLWHSVGRCDRQREWFFDADALAARRSSHCDLETFGAHLDFIGDRFRVIPIADAMDLMRRGARGFGRVAALTFDDGCRNVLEDAVPVLEARGWPCCVFVNAAMASGERLKDFDVLLYAINGAGPAAAARALKDAGVPGPSPDAARVAADFDLRAIAAHPRWPDARARLLDAVGATEREIASRTRAFATWAEWRARPASVSIGNHGREHLRLAQLDTQAAEREIVGGLEALRDELGIASAPYAFAFGQPGDISPAAHEIAASTHTGVLSAFGSINVPGAASPACRVPMFSSPDRRLIVEYLYPPRTLMAVARGVARSA